MSQEESSNGLKNALWEKLVDNLSDVSELKAELRVSIATLNEKIDRLLILEEKVEKNSLAITRIRTIWTVVAGIIAFAASFLKDSFFQNR
jgi:hypothetical protein